MIFHSRSIDNVTLLNVSGRIDVTNSSDLKHKLGQIASQQSTQVIVNLSHVSFMDSSGLAVLIQGMKRCREYGGDLLLCNLPKPVHMIFELTRLDKAVQIFDSEHDAIAQFQTQRQPLISGLKS